jgi:hypothetical protein
MLLHYDFELTKVAAGGSDQMIRLSAVFFLHSDFNLILDNVVLATFEVPHSRPPLLPSLLIGRIVLRKVSVWIRVPKVDLLIYVSIHAAATASIKSVGVAVHVPAILISVAVFE